MKQLITLGFLLSLSGCGIFPGLLIASDGTPDHIDISNTSNVATIRGTTRNVLVAHIKCSIGNPVFARKVTINAGPTNLDVTCTVAGQDTYDQIANFKFDAIAGHAYRVRILIPGSGNMELVDDTDNNVIGVVLSSSMPVVRW